MPPAHLIRGSERSMELPRGFSVEGRWNAVLLATASTEYWWWRREMRRLGRLLFASLHGTPAKTK